MLWLNSRCIFLLYISIVAFSESDTLVRALDVPVFNFQGGKTFVEVPENTTVGSKIGVLTLSNGNNLKITSTSSYVTVTDVTGDVSIQVDLILNTKLDHDYGPTQLQLTFEGRNDDVQNVNFQLLLFVNDVNDESPLLKNQPYSVTVPENTATNVVVSDKITAEDPDEGDTQTYRLETNAQGADDKYRNMFSIGSDGKLTLKGQLDFETTRFYQYTVIVEDKVGHNDSAAVYITVEDVQDTPPYFTGEPFINTIPEDWATGQPILTIRAADGDKGIPNSVRLNIKTESCPGLFQLDATSGELSLKTSADRDSGTVKNQNGICKLEVEATEGTEHVQTTGSSSSASTNVTITVSDINDNGPAFTGTPYSATVDENTQAGVPISLTSPITVEDSDQGENAQVEVKLKTYTEYFEVSPPLVQSTGQILIRVKNSTLLDYEKVQQLEIELEATDTKSPRLTTSAQVTLKINNINDNDPIFTKSSYSTSVSEDSSTGFSVIKIEAPDADKNDGAHKYGDVQYSLDGAESSFEIDPDTGVVSVGSNKLDRELRESYYLTVIAEDGGKRKVSTRLDIIIDDVNDNPPEFVTNDYQTSLKELETAFSRPVKVQATDKDKPNTKASEIQYSITATTPTGLESHFSIDDVTGKLDVKTALEYDYINFPSDHAGQIEVHVMAKDKGQPSLNSSVTVVVILQDVNNQSPVCDSNKYTVEISEGQIKASEVQQITAHDDDGSAPNNLLMYSIDTSFADKFVMNSTSGMLSLRDKLDREERDHYDISVTVMDLGVPAKSGQCVVSVTVKDINDEPPKFNQRETKVSFPENKDGFTLPCPAQDKDLNFTLSYSISWQNSSAISPSGQAVDLQSLKNGLQIDNKGIITSSIQFDREKLQQFILFVVVTDDNSVTGIQADTATVTVSIQDENDESPTFSASTYKAEIPENSPNGTEVQFGNSQSLTVTDKDESPNNEFSVRLDTYQDYFTIASPTGSERMQFTLSVKNNSILDYEHFQQLELQVITTDTNKPSFHNTATVSLSIINRNDNQPQFISATFSGSVKENQPSGTSVTTIQATDDDKGDFGKLTYSLPENLPEFTINQTTGEVFTAKEFDREVKDSYSMLVRVQDGGNYRTETQLTVDIVDLNDETPVFKQSHLEFEIAENQMYFIPALMVEAFDYDKVDTVNSDIKYSIISSNPPAVRSKFSINANTSEIMLNSKLDYEALDESLHGRILLTVEAKDQGSPQRSTTTTVTILVKDVNDISPHFDSNIYNIHKPENTSTATSVTTDWQTSNTTTTTAPTTSVQRYYQCHVDSVDLAIPVSVVPNSKLHLKESSCQLQNNGTHHVLSFGYHECGTSVAYYTDYIYATNDITVESTLPPNGLVVFADDYTIPLECRFHHEQFVNGAFQAVAIDSTILGRRGGADAADFILREFRTELYQDVITEYPAQIPLNKELFVEIALANANGGTTGIVVKECKATPSNDDNDNTTYTLIQDGCPAQPTVQLQPNPHNEIFRFSLQAFHFADPINQNNMVYLHCDVSICPVTSCTSNCAATKRRRRRSIAQLVDTVTVSSGPYLLV